MICRNRLVKRNPKVIVKFIVCLVCVVILLSDIIVNVDVIFLLMFNFTVSASLACFSLPPEKWGSERTRFLTGRNCRIPWLLLSQ